MFILNQDQDQTFEFTDDDKIVIYPNYAKGDDEWIFWGFNLYLQKADKTELLGSYESDKEANYVKTSIMYANFYGERKFIIPESKDDIRYVTIN